MTKDEALKLALEALQWNWGGEPLPTLELQAINAIKEVLAQPEQEPVAWMREDEDCTDCIVWEQTEEHTIPLYTTPPQRKPLTDEEIAKAWAQSKGDILMRLKPFARAIEAAHGIKGE